jgi:hypothetical protein
MSHDAKPEAARLRARLPARPPAQATFDVVKPCHCRHGVLVRLADHEQRLRRRDVQALEVGMLTLDREHADRERALASEEPAGLAERRRRV